MKKNQRFRVFSIFFVRFAAFVIDVSARWPSRYIAGVTVTFRNEIFP